MNNLITAQKSRSWSATVFVLLLITSCQQEEIQVNQIPQNDKDRILALGFNIDHLADLGEFYLVENDILLRKDRLYDYQPINPAVRDPKSGRGSQARVSDLISLENQRNITVFVDNTIPTAGDDEWTTEVQQAIADINAIPNSRIRMQMVTSGPADITIHDDAGALQDWVLASAEWPVSGNAGFQIRINLDADNNRVFTTGQQRYNMAHELGHCVGFRHTNWSGLGETNAIGINGTPNTGNNPDPNSVMNGGTALNTWNGFSTYDLIAYRNTYPAMTVSVTGPTKGYNNGTYTWSATASGGISPYTFVWHYSYDDTNYRCCFGYDPSVTGNLPLDRDLYLRAVATASDGEVAEGWHFTTNLGDPL